MLSCWLLGWFLWSQLEVRTSTFYIEGAGRTVVVILILVVWSPPASCADLYISASGDDASGLGTSSSPFRTLGKAFEACGPVLEQDCAALCTVHAARGVYLVNETAIVNPPPATDDCWVSRSFTLVGAGTASEVIFECTQASILLFSNQPADIALQNVTLRNCADAGVALEWPSSLLIDSSVVQSCGCGVRVNDSATLTASNSHFVANDLAIVYDASNWVFWGLPVPVGQLYHCTFESNAVGVLVVSAGLTDVSSTFVLNGAIPTPPNAAFPGGAMRVLSAYPVAVTLNASRFWSNQGEDGPAVFISAVALSVLTTVEVSFQDNAAVGVGGALYLEGEAAWFSQGDSFVSNAASVGGAAAVVFCPRATLFGATFAHNRATLHAGSLHANSSLVDLTLCSFHNSSALTGSGGALLAHLGDATTITNCTFTASSAFVDGGCVSVSSYALDISGSDFSGCTSGQFGGAVCRVRVLDGANEYAYDPGMCFTSSSSPGTVSLAENHSEVSVSTSHFSNCSARYGGAVSLSAKDLISLHDCTIHASRASVQGGAAFLLSRRTDVTECVFSECSAVEAGGIYLPGPCANITRSHFISTTAHTLGGALAFVPPPGASGDTQVLLDGVHTSGCSASRGGAAYLAGDAYVVDCSFEGGHADTDASAIYLHLGRAHLHASNFTNHTGPSMLYVSPSVPTASNAALHGLWMTSSSLVANAASALVALSSSASFYGQHLNIAHNAATPFAVASDATLALANCSLASNGVPNEYPNSGGPGGLYLQGCPGELAITHAVSISRSASGVFAFASSDQVSSCAAVRDLCEWLHSDASGTSDVCTTEAVSLAASLPASYLRSGDVLGAVVRRVDAFGRLAVAEGPRVALLTVSIDGGAALDGPSRAEFIAAQADVSRVTVLGIPTAAHATTNTTSHSMRRDARPHTGSAEGRAYTVSFQSASLASSVTVSLLPCPVGHINSKTDRRCIPCPYGTFSLDESPAPDSTCQVCPQQATCLGSDAVLTRDGYWRANTSVARDLFFLPCPHKSACLAGTCSRGYTGPACSVCASGFGRRGQWECVLCAGSAASPVLALVFLVVACFFVSILAHATARDAVRDSSSTSAFDEARNIAKVILEYLQVLSLARGIDTVWPAMLNVQLRVQSIVSNPTWFPSLDCLFGFHHARQPFLYRTLAIALLPLLAVFFPALFVALRCAYRRLRLRVDRSYFTPTFEINYVAMVLVSIYILYPFTYASLFNMFGCLEVSPGRYGLMAEMTVDCSSWEYRKWVLGLAVPAIVVYCAIVPALLFWLLLWASRCKDPTCPSRCLLDDASFRAKFGFLYCDYRPKVWWLGIVSLMQKMGIAAAVSIFEQRPALQSMACLGIILIPTLLMAAYAPYASRLLNRASTTANLLAAATVYVGLFSYILPDSRTALLPMAVAIVAANILFLVTLIAYMSKILGAHIHERIERRRCSSARRAPVPPISANSKHMANAAIVLPAQLGLCHMSNVDLDRQSCASSPFASPSLRSRPPPRFTISPASSLHGVKSAPSPPLLPLDPGGVSLYRSVRQHELVWQRRLSRSPSPCASPCRSRSPSPRPLASDAELLYDPDAKLHTHSALLPPTPADMSIPTTLTTRALTRHQLNPTAPCSMSGSHGDGWPGGVIVTSRGWDVGPSEVTVDVGEYNRCRGWNQRPALVCDLDTAP